MSPGLPVPPPPPIGRELDTGSRSGFAHSGARDKEKGDAGYEHIDGELTNEDERMVGHVRSLVRPGTAFGSKGVEAGLSRVDLGSTDSAKR